MPSFQDHVKQFSENLQFFERVNGHFPDQFDWQVTVCFYAALHLINAHLAKLGMQYRTHSDVTNAINPENLMSVMRIPVDPYVAYISLLNLSRRARYLINTENVKLETASFTYDKHLAKAVKKLDVLISWFANQYPEVKFEKINIKCIEIKQTDNLNYFQKVK